MLAAQLGNIEHVQLLLDMGAKVKVLDKIGKNVINYAVSGTGSYTAMRTQIIDLLIKYGANVFNVSYFGRSNILHMHIRDKHITDKNEMVQYLLSKGLDVNFTDVNGKSALMFVIQSNFGDVYQVFETLIEAGARVDIHDRFKETVLMYASKYGSTDMVRYLLELKDIRQQATKMLLDAFLSCCSIVLPLEIQNIIICYGMDNYVPDEEVQAMKSSSVRYRFMPRS
eukprot:TRINITY_DN2742_c0_g1_i2.p1 TRINITY_DN2742_c0_g1~~TRINITY_DN2742_c0_g1_i2.p1  ORF type:complete len:226 (-),score=28.61 TRINITY_DN2742_c0_g1_i2:33-710(-)